MVRVANAERWSLLSEELWQRQMKSWLFGEGIKSRDCYSWLCCEQSQFRSTNVHCASVPSPRKRETNGCNAFQWRITAVVTSSSLRSWLMHGLWREVESAWCKNYSCARYAHSFWNFKNCHLRTINITNRSIKNYYLGFNKIFRIIQMSTLLLRRTTFQT